MTSSPASRPIGGPVAALCAGNFVVGTSHHGVVGLINEIARSLDVSIADAGLIIAAFAVTSFCTAPLFATLGSRIDRRLLLSGALLIGAVANALAVLADSYHGLMLTRVLAAVTAAIFTPQAAATLGVMAPAARRGQAISIVMAGWGLASVIGVPLGVMVGSRYGWHATMAGIAVSGLAAAVAVWATVPEGVRVARLDLRSWAVLFSHRGLLLVLAASLALGIGNNVAFTYLAAMTEAFHPSAAGGVVAAVFAVHGVASLASNLLTALLLPALGANRIAGLMTAGTLVALGLWPFCALWLAAVLVLQAAWSLSFAGYPGIQQTRLILLAPALAPISISFNSSLNYMSSALGAGIGGAAWTLVGPRYLPWIGLPFLAIGLVLVILGSRAGSSTGHRDAADDAAG